MGVSSRIDRQVSLLITTGAIVIVFGQSIPELLAQPGAFASWWNVAGLMCAGAYVGMGVTGLWLPMRVLRVLWVALPITQISLQLISFATLQQAVPVVPWVWTLEATSVWMLVLVLRPFLVVAVAILSSCTVALSAWLFIGFVPTAVATATPIHMCNIGFVALFLGIRVSLTRFRDAEQAAKRAAEERARSTALEMRQEEFGRFVHDEVLSVMNAALFFHGDPPEALREEARSALDVLAESDVTPDSPPVPPDEVVRMLRARLSRFIGGAEWVIDVAGPALPGVVVAEFSAAAAEAARNIAQHGEATRVIVAVRISGGAIEVTVTDDGRGFEVTSETAGRMGVRNSIIARIEDVSGSATVVSSPGAGTEVCLSWSP